MNYEEEIVKARAQIVSIIDGIVQHAVTEAIMVLTKDRDDELAKVRRQLVAETCELPFPCGTCGSGQVRLADAGGKPYGIVAGVEEPIPAGVRIPVCDQCGDTYTAPWDTCRILLAFALQYRTERDDARLELAEERKIRQIGRAP